MKEVVIKPKKLKGSISIPPSKSIAHRAIICASLCDGISRVTNVDFSKDIIATINAMKMLGAKIEKYDDSLVIDGSSTLNNKRKCIIDCNESGSTLRFLIPISIIKDNEIEFIGGGNLGKRPLDIYYNIFNEQKIEYSYDKNKLDLKVNGRLRGGTFKVKGNISSQFITGLLFTLPLLEEDSVINITTELESKSYVDLTLDVIRRFGIKIENDKYKRFIVKGNQKFMPIDYNVEGDYSQGAFYLCADALRNNVDISGLNLESLQGDKEILSILRKLGAQINIGKIMNVSSEFLKANIIDGSQCPDIIPIVTVVCALSNGVSRIINSERLRFKECDRLNAICTELNKLGADISETEDGLIINGVSEFIGGTVNSHNDHRIAMSLAIAATCCKNDVIIEDSSCVSKSYPGFWHDYKLLGGNIDERILGQ